MILKGKLELIHKGHYSKHLKPFDQDTFSGEWETHSKGKVTDFNLMLKSGATGSLRHCKIETDNDFSFIASTDYYFIYLVSGNAILDNGNIVKEGDLLQATNGTEIMLHAKEDCDLIIIDVSVGAVAINL